MNENQFCDKVVDIITKSLNRFDNGDSSMMGGITQLMGIANSPIIDSDKEIELGLNILEIIDDIKSGKIDEWIGDVDYNPNLSMSKLLNKSGIPDSAAPWKSIFKIYKSRGSLFFEYKIGYGKPFLEIYCNL